jgi:restriction endonuclease S subunit
MSAGGAAREGLPLSEMTNLPVFVPPLQEQNRIMAHIQRVTARIQAAIEKSQHQIDLIREYRTRLIADVVTGKLDLRDAQIEQIETHLDV